MSFEVGDIYNLPFRATFDLVNAVLFKSLAERTPIIAFADQHPRADGSSYFAAGDTSVGIEPYCERYQMRHRLGLMALRFA